MQLFDDDMKWRQNVDLFPINRKVFTATSASKLGIEEEFKILGQLPNFSRWGSKTRKSQGVRRENRFASIGKEYLFHRFSFIGFIQFITALYSN